ncbi:MAG: hypothetical protein J6X79_00150 [Bacteroidales bacterium]|nr:hypothetical protein [Bacteroidales bacterium]
MKNIFKLLGIAVLACSMMVACGPDETEVPDPTPTPEPQPQPTTVANVTLGTYSWDAATATIYTANYEQYGLNEYTLYKTSNSEYPFVDFMVQATPGTYSAEATLGQAEGYTYYGWQNMDIYDINYFEANVFSQQTSTGGTVYRGDWRPVTASLTVTAFDLNSLTASFVLTATMYDYASWYQDLVTNAEDADTKDMTVTVNNYTFTAVSK